VAGAARSWHRRKISPAGADRSHIADFVCIDMRLIVELDGPTHEQHGRRIYDSDRDEWLRAQGWHVLRFPNDVVIGSADIVVARIKEIVAAAGPHPSRFA
jgi:very-short-patch-repair endonuclease